MDGWVSESLPRPQDLPHHSSSAKPVHTRWRIIFVFSGVLAYNELSADWRRRKDTEASLLYKPSVKRGRRTISNDGKASLCLGHGFLEVKTLLSGPCHKCLNKSSTKKGDEQVRSCMTTNPMGHRTQRVWCQVPRSAMKAQVLADFGGFHCKVHSQSRWAR